MKLWNIPENGLSENALLDPVKTFRGFKNRPELLEHHTVAEDILSLATGSDVQVWNLSTESSISSTHLVNSRHYAVY